MIGFASNISFLDMIFLIKSMVQEDNINCIDFFSIFPILSSELLYIFIYNLPQHKLYIFQLLSDHIG